MSRHLPKYSIANNKSSSLEEVHRYSSVAYGNLKSERLPALQFEGIQTIGYMLSTDKHVLEFLSNTNTGV